MLSCRAVRSRIAAAQDRSLALEAELELETHVARCEECRAFAESAAKLEEALLGLAEPRVERIDFDALASSIAARIERAGRPKARRPVVARAALAAAALGAAWIGGSIWLSPREIVPAPVPEVGEAVDLDRLAVTRAEVRGHLLAAAARLPVRASGSDARAFAARFDELAAPLARSGWPVARLVAGFAEDGDVQVARAAARYLGLRGDALALRWLDTRAATGEDDLLAAIDAGEAALETVARVCSGVEGAPEPIAALARERVLAEWSPRLAARAFETAVRRCGPESPAREPLLAALAGCGGEGVDSILRLGGDGAIDPAAMVAALRGSPEARARLAEIALEAEGSRSAGELDPASFALALAEIQPLDALPWLMERVREPRERAGAVAALAAYRDAGAWAALLTLADDGWLDDADLGQARTALLARGDGAVAEVAERALALDRPRLASILRDTLIESEDPAAAPALARLAAGSVLDDSERELAARAVGDFGRASDASELASVLHGLGRRERRIAAACVDSIWRLGGEDAVAEALAGAPRQRVERVLDALPRAPKSSAAESRASVSLVQIARALDPILERAAVADSRGLP